MHQTLSYLAAPKHMMILLTFAHFFSFYSESVMPCAMHYFVSIIIVITAAFSSCAANYSNVLLAPQLDFFVLWFNPRIIFLHTQCKTLWYFVVKHLGWMKNLRNRSALREINKTKRKSTQTPIRIKKAELLKCTTATVSAKGVNSSSNKDKTPKITWEDWRKLNHRNE